MRGSAGHFLAQVDVDGREIVMLIDSGATSVVLNRADAEAVGIAVSDDRFTGSALTAGGRVRVMPVTLARVRLGDIERRDVRAAVVDDGLAVSLLGQSFLATVDEVAIAGDTMTLR